MSDFDPYIILGLERSASAADIKAAYKRMAKITHPDLTKDDGELFKSVGRAWTILSNLESKKMFDETGVVDEVSVDRVTRGVGQFLSMIFEQILDQALDSDQPLTTYDYLGFIRSSTTQALSTQKAEIEDLKKKMDALRSLKTRIKRGDDKANFFTDSIDKRILAAGKTLAQAQFDARVMESALEECQNYTNEVDLMQTVVWRFNNSSTSSNSTSGSL